MNTSSQNCVVLLVEDSDDDAFFFERAFASAGIPAQLVHLIDGGAAVEYLERVSAEQSDLSQTHIMFLDLKMPVLSGFDVLKWLRERNLSIETFVLSGSDLDSDLDAVRELGASGYIVKPISTAELQRRFKESRFGLHVET